MPPSNVPETITENVSEKKGCRGKIRLGNAGFLAPREGLGQERSLFGLVRRGASHAYPRTGPFHHLAAYSPAPHDLGGENCCGTFRMEPTPRMARCTFGNEVEPSDRVREVYQAHPPCGEVKPSMLTGHWTRCSVRKGYARGVPAAPCNSAGTYGETYWILQQRGTRLI